MKLRILYIVPFLLATLIFLNFIASKGFAGSLGISNSAIGLIAFLLAVTYLLCAIGFLNPNFGLNLSAWIFTIFIPGSFILFIENPWVGLGVLMIGGLPFVISFFIGIMIAIGEKFSK